MLPSDSGTGQDEDNSEEAIQFVISAEKRKKTNDESALQGAYEACKNKELGIQEAALLFGVHKRKLKSILDHDDVSVIDENYRVFVLTVFPLQAEIDIAECLQELVSSHVHMTNIDVRRFGYELIREKYKVDCLPDERNCILGQRWFNTLMEKYPQLNLSHPDFKGSMENQSNFYDSLENFVNVFGIDSTTIFYVDGIDLRVRAASVEDPRFCPKRKTIYADCKAIVCTSPEGMFVPPILLKLPDSVDSNMLDVYDLDTDGEEIEQEDGNESENKNTNENDDNDSDDDSDEYEEEQRDNPKDANYRAPVRTTKINSKLRCNKKVKRDAEPASEDVASIREQIKAHLSKKSQSKSEENVEELRENLQEQFSEMENRSAWGSCENTNPVTPQLFYSWLEKFLTHVRQSVNRKILLLLREPDFVKYYRTLELARQYGVVFLVMPPHSVHKIYPLDGVTMSLTRNLTIEAKRWIGKHGDFKMNEVPLVEFFKKAYSETVNPSIARNGFLYSGLWPINRNIFKSPELGGASQLLQTNCPSGVGDASLHPSSGTESLLPGISTESDIQKLCRVCMKETAFMKPLFEPPPSSEPNYDGKKMAELSNIPISPGDGLPSSICQYCIVKLKDAIKTKQKAAESHRKQMKLLEAYNRVNYGHGEHEDRELMLILQEFASKIYTKMINKLLSKTFDMSSICRVCMDEKPLLTSIFFLKTDYGNTYHEEMCQKIMLVSQCQIHIQDGMSGFICPFCRALINQAYDFIQKVVSSNQRFREILATFRGNC